jgi:GT2 family glycosyltransferase
MLIATLVYNTPDLALDMQAQLPDILLIDKGSERPIPGAAVRLDQIYFFSGGWNRALALMETDYVWTLNSDIQGVSHDMGLALVDYLNANPRAACVSPAYNSPQRFMRPQGCGVRQVPWMDWAGPMVLMQAWRDVGGFDEDTFRGYGGDVDRSHRARLRGWTFHVCDSLQFYHIGCVTVRRCTQPEAWSAYNNHRILKDKWGRAILDLLLHTDA